MDRLIYVSMTGARQALDQQATIAHNLANLSTTGFRAQVNAFRSIALNGEGAPTRSYVVDSTVGTDFRPGVIQRTGRDLDVAILGQGFLAVQLPDGSEAYTRSGNLSVGPGGVLITREGLQVVGEGGPISLPPDSGVTVAKDGTVSAIAAANRAVTVVGRLKLVNPPAAEVVRGDDGLFRARGGAAPADPGVTLAAGSLESSNVNAVEAMIALIANARAFELHVKMLQHAETNDRSANQVLSLNR